MTAAIDAEVDALFRDADRLVLRADAKLWTDRVGSEVLRSRAEELRDRARALEAGS